MSRPVRLALAAVAVAFAVVPVAPASASTCSPAFEFVCATVDPICQRFDGGLFDIVHTLLCEFG